MPSCLATACSSHYLSKKITLSLISTSVCCALLFTGCSNNDTVTDSKTIATQTDLSIFEGCYTVSSEEPAQIRVSKQQGAWVMQMKEPAGAKQVWDKPERLELIGNNEIPKFFSIDPDNVDAVIGRPDRVLVLAHVKPVYANIDPLLDSEYLSYIYRGANTIYRIECDDINTDILADPHSNKAVKKGITSV